ncbi:hypothetical protein R5R35_012769 [Gryllus longicercus]|uniref:Uncharacterized protein n=1 Tax=Gryllus longicercus TaxID=2509291 RepID=A0AAN9VE48_9ORTH
MASSRYHLRERAYLIGYIEPHITGNKLPTNAQVLKSIFYNTRRLIMSLSKSIKKVNKEVKFYWQKAQIPIQGQYRCLRKMFKLHNEYRSLQKDLNKPGHKERENLFQQNLEVIFDIATSNVLETVTEELKQFLMDQRSIHRH